MSDSESTAAAAAAAATAAAPAPAPAQHPTVGGKSLESVQQQQTRMQSDRPPYKSWRKKYRKMRGQFDGVLEENKTLFRQEHKLEGTAKRLREELDELLEILLDINQSPAIPVELRFDVRTEAQRRQPSIVPPDIGPQASNDLMLEYTAAVQQGRIPPLDLHVVREQLSDVLAAQSVTPLEVLESRTPHPLPTPGSLPAESRGDDLPGFLTTDEESTYLTRLDAALDNQLGLEKDPSTLMPTPHQADLTPRELERQMELMNPQSQHNWLRLNTKIHDDADTESLLDGSSASKTPTSRKRGGQGKTQTLAKQVGDRALERAKEGGMSPSAASGFGEEDELIGGEDLGGSGRKRVKDADGAYRVKGGKGGAGKGKRKRTTEEGGSLGVGGGSKKAKVGDGMGDS